MDFSEYIVIYFFNLPTEDTGFILHISIWNPLYSVYKTKHYLVGEEQDYSSIGNNKVLS